MLCTSWRLRSPTRFIDSLPMRHHNAIHNVTAPHVTTQHRAALLLPVVLPYSLLPLFIIIKSRPLRHHHHPHFYTTTTYSRPQQCQPPNRPSRPVLCPLPPCPQRNRRWRLLPRYGLFFVHLASVCVSLAFVSLWPCCLCPISLFYLFAFRQCLLSFSLSLLCLLRTTVALL